MSLSQGVHDDAFRDVASRLHISPSTLLHALNRLARERERDRERDSARELTEAELAAYRAVGGMRAQSVSELDDPAFDTDMQRLALLADGYSVKQASELLGCSESRIRQRIEAGSLRAYKVDRTWRLPRFQFTEDGALPAEVLAAAPREVHPVTLQRFLRRPHPDLRIHGDPVSPLAWLTAHGDPARVTRLVAELDLLV